MPFPAGEVCDTAGEMGVLRGVKFILVLLCKNFIAKLQRFTDTMVVEKFSLWGMF